MRTRESAQIHTLYDGRRSIQHEYLDPYTGKPIPIGGSILLAGVRYHNDLQAPTAVMSADGFKSLLYYCKSMNENPKLPKTDVKLDFACVVDPDGTYARSDGSIKHVVWFNQQLALEGPQLALEGSQLALEGPQHPQLALPQHSRLAIQDSIPQVARDWIDPPVIRRSATTPQSMPWLSHAPADEYNHEWAERIYEVSAAHPLALSSAHALDPLTHVCV